MWSTAPVPPVLGANDLVKQYGEHVVLDRVSLTLEAGERVGLVGLNGSGKSTLSRILAGLYEADDGQVTCARDARLAYLEQVPQLDEALSACDTVLAGLPAWSLAVARHEEVSAAIADRATADGADGADGNGGADGDSRSLDDLLAAQEAAAAEVERLGGWDLRHQAEAMLGHLGIAQPEKRVGTMSGGERRRVALARLLVSRPDLAILDEPTNHLDVKTIEWLERYLVERFTGALLLITHDRYLLDRVVVRTLEIEDGALYSYEGGWERYLIKRAERQAQAERVAANRRNLLRRELEWMRRQPKARTGKQKARIDRANALLDTRVAKQRGTAAIKVDAVRSGNTILDVEQLSVAVAGRTLVENLTLRLGKGERIGIVGKNGSGKTSLLRVLMGEEEPAAGSVTLGKNTRIAYLDQGRGGLDDGDTVFDSVAQGRTHIHFGGQELTVYAFLERFLFRPNEQKKKIASLSGGERARVALARTLRDQANLVILDEPTNDLDVTTLAAVEEALLDFPGTALIVTHDRFFLDRVATSILAFEADAGVVHVYGNYQRYLDYREAWERERKQAESDSLSATDKAGRSGADRVAADQRKAKPKKKGLSYRERQELDGLLERIDAAETAVAELESALTTPRFYDLDHVAQAEFLSDLAERRQTAEALVERWAELESRDQET